MSSAVLALMQDEFVSYVRPLIQGDVSPVMVDGIPRHLYRQL